MSKNSLLKKRERKSVFLLIVFVVLFVYSVSLIFPLSWAVFSSLKSDIDFTVGPFELFPYDGLQFENWWEIFEVFNAEVYTEKGVEVIGLLQMLFYSVVYSVGVPLVANFTRSMCAYVCARYKHLRFPGWIYSLAIVLMTMTFPSNLAVSIEFYKLVGIYNNLWMLIITSISFSGANFLYLYAAYIGLSKEYAEAAQLDGANQFQIMFNIMMPMVKNIFAAVFILDFIAMWNNYSVNVTVLPNYPMLAYGLFKFQSKNPRPTIPIQLASSTVLMIPTLLLFVLFSDKLMSNLSIGGIKG